MEQRVVLQDNTKIIYWIQDKMISFYLVIPMSNSVHLALGIEKNVNDEKIKEVNATRDSVFVIPVVQEQILSGITENRVDYFNLLDGIFSETINMAYQILVYNHIDVRNGILFNENKDYMTFIQWFIQKYASRVSLVQYKIWNDVVDNANVVPIIEEKKEDVIPPQVVDTSTILEKSQENEVSHDDTVHSGEGKDLGFVSYVLLGVVVAVASLVLLYFII